MDTANKKYWNPYLSGIGLGLTLLASFLIMGRGLGASGAFTSILTSVANLLSSEFVSGNELFNSYMITSKGNPAFDWLVFEIIGVFIGAFISALFAKRIKIEIEKGENINNKQRILYAFSGGIIMGFAAKLARGCTSGQALSGGALLSVGSWIFMLSVFAGAYAVAYWLRRLWL